MSLPAGIMDVLEMSDIFVHHQENISCITASGITHVCRCWLVSCEFRNSEHPHDTSRQRHTCVITEVVIQFRCSWWWAKISLETCRSAKELSYTVASCWPFLYIISWCTETWISRLEKLTIEFHYLHRRAIYWAVWSPRHINLSPDDYYIAYKFSFILISVGVPSLNIFCNIKYVLVLFFQSFCSSSSSLIFRLVKVKIKVKFTL